MLRLVKKHYLILIIALMAGIMTSVPQIIEAKKVVNFQGIYKAMNNDERYYFARARDVMDGHSFLGNPYLFEHKNEQPMQFWLPDYILAKPLAILNIENIHYGYIFYDFLLPTILTLLTYSIIYLLTRSKTISFLSTAFLHLNLFLYIFNRAPSPQLNFIFWLLLFLFWLKFLQDPSRKNALLTGIFFGLLFHVYTYYWTFYVVFFAVFIGINFLLKRKIEYRKYLLIGATAFAIAIPYFISMIKSVKLSYYSESLARVGMINTHLPSGTKIVGWGMIILILLYVSYKKEVIKLGQRSIFLLSGSLAAMIVTNQQIITGKNLQFSSHYWMPSVFIYIFVLAFLFSYWQKKIKNRKIKVLLIIFVGVYIFYYPINYVNNIIMKDALKYRESEIMLQDYAPLFNWLNKNTELDSVVYADSDLSAYIPIYTSNNIYSFAMAGLHFMSDEEFQERFILNNYWDEFNKEYLLNKKFSVWCSYYVTRNGIYKSENKLRKLFFIQPKEYEFISQEEIERILKMADEIKSRNFEEQLKKYRVDYFVQDKKKDVNWKLEKLDFLQLLVEVDGFLVYKVRSEK